MKTENPLHSTEGLLTTLPHIVAKREKEKERKT
jgi:hypothetical protein